ncbi:MAG: kelch repeat-containing protein [bacterium]|nr:kelch repeat-containing protein [bacterium]
MKKKYVFCFIFLFVLVSTLLNASRWSLTDSLVFGRKGHSLAVLTDGRVMVLGGYPPAPFTQEIFFPSTGRWEVFDSMPYSGLAHSVGVLMTNGKVLAGDGGDWYFYEPATNTWDTTAMTFGWETSHCYTVLKDGRLLANYDNTAYLLVDTNGTYATTASSPSEHDQGIEVLLRSGKVLAMGGFGFAPVGAQAQVYNPVSANWTAAPNSPVDRGTGHMGVLLAPEYNDEVIVFGGTGTSSTLYNETSNSWTASGNMAYSRDIGAPALLPNGKVLMIGGDNSGVNELYDPVGKTWSIVDTMIWRSRTHFSIAILPTGKVLAVGSFNNDTAAKLPEIYDPTNPAWTTKTSLKTAREAATITLLPIEHTSNCSTNVLISGGEGAGGILNTCELYNYKMDSTAYTGSLNTARTHHTANLISSDQVLAAGGRNAGGAVNSCEIWDLVSGNWTTTGTMATSRFDHSATQLKDGKILVTGGENTGYVASCEVFNSGAWTPTGTMATARARHSAILLLNGNVLVIGGETAAGTYTATCEIWDGTTWTSTGSLATARSLQTAILLQSGKVLVMGGRNSGGALSSCEIYDPLSGTWSPETPLNTARYAHNASLLYSGLVLVSGGYTGSSYLNSCELFDPAVCNPVTELHQWKTIPSPMATNRAYHGSVLIPIDKPYILAIGGNNGSFVGSIESFDIGLGYLDTWQSTIGNFPAVTTINSTMDINGNLFRGISEADGGNHCHVSSNDHPIISLVRVGGGNWQGNGGGEILTMPNSSSWSETRTIVHPVISDFQGYYRLWSIVNGIPCKWYKDCGAAIEENKNYKSSGIKIYPNPGIKEIKFALNNKVANLSVDIYDLSGRTIKSLNGKEMNTLIWDGKDTNGKKVSAGMYFYNVRGDGINQKGKFVMLK